MEDDNENVLNATSFVSEGRWPLSFSLKLPQPNPARGKPTWFNYDLYRGHRDRKPELLYAKTKQQSENIAYYSFLAADPPHRILGFDLEWPSFPSPNTSLRLCDRVALITIASESTIALFHLAAHAGDTPAELLAPSLRALIESPAILKAGVNILAADFRRLQKWFDLRPQGAAELSHLHGLVTAGALLGNCTTKPCALERLVKVHLGLPLDKGNGRVRTGNWTRKVLSGEQRLYAANDAYACLLLYHYLEARRLAMAPMPPPPPLWHERYEWFEHIPGRRTGLLLQVDENGDRADEAVLVKVILVSDWAAGRREKVFSVDPERIILRSLSPAPAEEPQPPAASDAKRRRTLPATPSGRRRRAAVADSPASQRKKSSRPANSLLAKLKDHREKIARQRRLELFQVTRNSALEEIARKRPRSIPEMMELKGLGKKTCDKYGKAFLNIVALHERQEAANEGEGNKGRLEASSSDESPDGRQAQNGPNRRRMTGPVTPVSRAPPSLHTGLTLSVQRTSLLQARGSQDRPIDLDESDEELPVACGDAPLVPATPTWERQRPVSAFLDMQCNIQTALVFMR